MKKNVFILSLLILAMANFTFSSCSDDDEKNEGEKNSSSLVGLWLVDDPYDSDTYFEFNSDGTLRCIEIDLNTDGTISSHSISLSDWKDNKGRVTLTRGVIFEYFDYFMASDGQKMNVTDQDKKSYNLKRISKSEANALIEKLPLDPDLVGFWEPEKANGESYGIFVEIDPDGYAHQLTVNESFPSAISTTWEIDNGKLTFLSYDDLKSSQNYEMAPDKSYFMFGTAKYKRITEKLYKQNFDSFYSKHSLVGAWEDMASWTSDMTSSVMNPKYTKNYILFHADGSFLTLQLVSKKSNGSEINEVKQYDGKYKFDRSLLTYRFDNDDLYGTTPYMLEGGRLYCGLPFDAPAYILNKYFGSGKFKPTDVKNIQPYINIK